MKMKMSIRFRPLFGVIIAALLSAGSISNAQAVLNKYIQAGIENNIALKQKNISVQKAKTALEIARSLFYPSVTVLADYTDGKGGRAIDIPIGDLLNPVYSTLNALTQSNSFPQVSNVKQDFFPHSFYDVKARTAMPLLNTDIYFNRQLKEESIKLQEYDRLAYQRTLVLEIKKAYYGYMSAADGIRIYNSILLLAGEALRVNESLIANGKGLPVHKLRIETEIAQLQVKLSEMQNKADEARRYFNFLLNRDNTDSIECDTVMKSTALAGSNDAISGKHNAGSKREELLMLQTGNTLYGIALKMKEYKWVPVINAFADYGAQDSKWNYGKDSRYYLYGVQLSLPVFEGFRTVNEQEEARLNLSENTLALTETERKLELAATSAKNNVTAAQVSVRFAEKQLETARAYYSLIAKGYKEGIHSMLEMTDARAQLTSAEMQYSVSLYTLLTETARYERETAQ